MTKTPRYLAGLWLGATISAFGMSLALLYAMTGNVLVPQRKGAQLVPAQEAVHAFGQWIKELRRD